MDCVTPSARASQSSANSVQSESSLRLRKPSRRSIRAVSRSAVSIQADTRRLPRAMRGLPTALSASTRRLELGSECRILGCELFVRFALDGRPRRGRRGADGFRVLQVGIDGGHDDAGFNGDEVDAYEGNPHPRVDDDALVEDAVKNVNKTAAACCAFYSHRNNSFTATVRLRRIHTAIAESTAGGPSPQAAARASAPASAAPRSPPRAAACPARGGGHTSTNRGRFVPPCRWSRPAGGSESSGARLPRATP